jgi:TonB-linked SusC/RagA family outer membrane protein
MKRITQQLRFKPKVSLWKMVVCSLLFSASFIQLEAQTNNGGLTMRFVNERLTDALKKVERNSDYKIIFSYNEIQSYKVSANISKASAPEAVRLLIAGQPLTSTVDGKYIHVFQKKGAASKKGYLVGQVIDENDDPLIGVSVRFKNDKGRGTVTDANGNFYIPAANKQSSTLTFSYIGKKTMERTFVEGDKDIVRMVDNVNSIDEVVVTGYQVIDKRLMSSSTTTVKMDDIKIPNFNSVDKMLQGTVPGLMVLNNSGSPSATPRIRVRGSSTVYGNAAPLWVVDGIIHEDPVNFSNDELNNILMGSPSDLTNQMNLNSSKSLLGNAISGVNPNDIESITFLKDASATAIYGTRAANGVIVITTKKGRVGKPSVSFSTSLGFTSRPRYSQYNLMNSKQRVQVSKEVLENGYLYAATPYATGFEGALMNLYDKKITKEEFDAQVAKYETMNTDWFDLLCQNALNQDYSVSISGGNDYVNYYTSVGYNNSKGTTKGDNSIRYNFSSNIDAKLSSKVRAYTRLSLSETTNDGFYTTNPYSYALDTSRAIGANEYYTSFVNTIAELSSNYALKYNIFNELSHTGSNAKVRNFSGSFGVDVDILKNLKLQTLFGATYSNSLNNQWADERSYHIAQIRGYDYGAVAANSDAEKVSTLPHGGILNYTSMNNVSYTGRAQLTYNLMFGKNHEHIINAMGGYEVRSNQYDGYTDVEYGYYPDRGLAISYEYDTSTSGNVSNVSGANSSLEKHTVSRSKQSSNTISGFATLVYGYKNRYILNANIRTDASNRFGQYTNHKWLPVWSLSARWKVNDEAIFKDMNWIDEFSIRASYGEQGNVPTSVGPNLVVKYISPTINRFSGDYQLGISRLPYPNLRWEKTKTTNLGLDFSFMNGRITGDIDYYIRKGTDVIYNLPVATEYGTTTTYRNGANLKNTGIEIGLSFTPIRTRDFTWTISPIYSKNTNNISNTTKQKYTYLDYLAGNAYENGKPIRSVYAWKFNGINQNTGYATFDKCSNVESEVTKSDTPSEYLKYCGTSDPKFNGGVSTALRYKNLSLNAQFAFAFGNKKRLNFMFNGKMTMPEPQSNLTTDLINRWKKAGDVSNIPGIVFSESSNYLTYTPAGMLNTYDMYNYSDVRVVSGNFFRCRNLMLSYSFPQNLIQHWRISGMSCSFNVSNPFTICSSKFHGQDPEIDNTGSVALPITQTYSFSLNFSF